MGHYRIITSYQRRLCRLRRRLKVPSRGWASHCRSRSRGERQSLCHCLPSQCGCPWPRLPLRRGETIGSQEHGWRTDGGSLVRGGGHDPGTLADGRRARQVPGRGRVRSQTRRRSADTVCRHGVRPHLPGGNIMILTHHAEVWTDTTDGAQETITMISTTDARTRPDTTTAAGEVARTAAPPWTRIAHCHPGTRPGQRWTAIVPYPPEHTDPSRHVRRRDTGLLLGHPPPREGQFRHATMLRLLHLDLPHLRLRLLL